MKNCIKYILLAQTASDAGKGIRSDFQNLKKANFENYDIKDRYIRQAIGESKKYRNITVNISRDKDIIYFNIKGFQQISFHIFEDYSKFNLETGGWLGYVGSSDASCRKLAKRFKLTSLFCR